MSQERLEPGAAELLAAVAMAARENPVCWVAVEGIRLPIPITAAHPPSGEYAHEPRRVPVPGTRMYLQYDPAHGNDNPEGAALHYLDEEGGREVPRRDRVWYGNAMQRRLPFALAKPADHNRPRRMCAFLTQSEARRALGLRPV